MEKSPKDPAAATSLADGSQSPEQALPTVQQQQPPQSDNTTTSSSLSELTASPSSGIQSDLDTSLQSATSVSSSPESSSPESAGPESVPPIERLLGQTGYGLVQQNGQRRFGPPPDWEGAPPPRGCEVFVGKIPRDCFEDELVPVFQRAGNIFEMRLMMDYFTVQNRGYAFVVYTRPFEAKESVRLLNNYEIRKGRTLGVCMSVDNCRLFVGGIPKKVSKDDIIHEMSKVTEGVMDVIVYPSASDKTKNRGFAFVEYDSHRSAAMARRKLMNGRVQLWGHSIAVDWAEPELEVAAEIMSQVKVLYVRNLMLSTTEAQIEEVFSQHATVERVKKIRDYAFVHFHSKEDAHAAMMAVNATLLDGAQVEVALAKPVDKDAFPRSPKQANKQLAMPAFYVPVDQFGSVMPFYPSYYSPPSRYMLRNSMGACSMSRMSRTSRGGGAQGGGGGGRGTFFPMTVPTSTPRFVYPTNQIKATPTAGTPFYTTQTYFDPSKRLPDEQPLPLIEMTPQMAQGAPSAATATMAIKSPKTSSQILEEICQKNNWALPIFTLHSALSGVPTEEPLYICKVYMAALGMTYIPAKLSHSVEEAKSIAAEHTLTQIGYPVEARSLQLADGLAGPSYPAAAGYITLPPNATPKPPHNWGPSPHEQQAAAIFAPAYQAEFATASPTPCFTGPPEMYPPGF